MGEQKYLNLIRNLRWREGLRCPRCGGERCTVHTRSGPRGRRKYHCFKCLRAFSDLTGTPFANSHIPLSKWFACAQTMLERERTCADISKRLNIRLATAWRIRTALTRALADPAFENIVKEALS